MKIKLEARAETVDGITTALYQAIRMIKKEFRSQRGKDERPYECDHLKPFEAVDDNCYGEVAFKVSNTR